MFDEWDEQKARAAITTPDWLVTNKRLYDGDHWLDSLGWAGPRPALDDTNAQAVLLEIARAFISSNKVAETVKRHADAVIGKEPAWALTPARSLADGEQPSAEEQALIGEAEAALTALWDARGLHSALQQAIRMLLWAGRAPLRLYVPEGELDENGRVPIAPLADSLGRIYLDTPLPSQSCVVTDTRTRQQAGVYIYQDADDATAHDRTELVYLDAAGRTLITVFGQEAQAALDLGGRLTIHQMVSDVLITAPVRQQQSLLNMAKTMMGRNVVLGGFLERIIFNAQLPSTDAFRVGAGTTNVLMGAPLVDEAGNVTGYTNPSINYRDPVPVDTFEDTERSAYRSILEETNQLHVMINGDATASGESRKQARADFENSIGPTVAQAERAIRWLLETLLAMGAAFAGQPGRYADLRAVVTCRVSSGPISADEQDQTRQNVAAGLLSKETGMARLGVDDVDAEKTKIAAEGETANQAQQTNATAILGRAGLLAQQVRSDGQTVAQNGDVNV